MLSQPSHQLFGDNRDVYGVGLVRLGVVKGGCVFCLFFFFSKCHLEVLELESGMKHGMFCFPCTSPNCFSVVSLLSV